MRLALLPVVGGLGAALRVGVGMLVYRRRHAGLPVGTAVVNLVGAFVYGSVVGSDLTGNASDAILGFLAGFTTFSSWIVDLVAVWGDPLGGRARSGGLIAGLLVLGLVAAALGYAWRA
jgi:fluoride exporter